MQEVQVTLPNGTIIHDRYVVEDLLGKGGFGAVYLVRDLRVRGNLFALKEVVDPNKQDRERFIFEGEVLKRLDHQALPRVYRAFENDRQARAYILMDYIDGPNLEILRQRQPEKHFSLSEVLAFMAPIMDAVAYLHNQRPPIIHRDIKPSNIIVSSSGNESVLVDFGIAKEYDPESTTTAIRRCSPGYGAPEQYSKGTDPRTDIYGLGATIYSLLTGVVPTDALYRLTQLGSRGADPLEPVNQLMPAIPQSVADVIHQGMAIDINARFPTVEQFRQALQAAASQPALPVQAPVPPPPVRSQAPVVIERPVEDVTAHSPGATTQRVRARRPLALLLLIPALLLVFGAVAFGMYIARTSSSVTPAPTTQRTAAAAPSHTPALTAPPKPKPTSAPTSVPTAPPAGYPSLVTTYHGNVHNTPANVNGNMTLSSVRQNQGGISGNFTVGGPYLIGSGPFDGSVDTKGAINFTVRTSNVRPLFFSGVVHKDGSMDGTYCSLDVNNRCNQAVGGYGTWHVTPASQSSSSSSIIGLPGSDAARRNGEPAAIG